MTPEDKIKSLEKQLKVAIRALKDIQNWNEEMEDGWEDQGDRAGCALTIIDKIEKSERR